MINMQIVKHIVSAILLVASTFLMRLAFPDMEARQFVIMMVAVALIAMAAGLCVFQLDIFEDD